MKHIPIGAIAWDSIDAVTLPRINIGKLKNAIDKYAPSDIQADGTCIYIIRTISPCL
ncbi:hypothetical protein NLO413_0520 [Candidatus Neoehrlichia lotoris str. RAC413]|uniref:Uncharacterized protein n=1 Tax=Candidatus Neoehrlichia procyonis str. RAC413 TaxID=1359163 RepID=A0A0F3NM63_9RICK|nr:hypothetical protein NLO413_0520 [Candidatus Neoehrlichia lotoris str. RAC413]